MSEIKQYNIFEYTEYPGPRYKHQGEFSSENLYLKIIKPLFEKAIETSSPLAINLDGTAGYASSFIDELFGNIVYDFGSEVFDKFIVIISNEEPEWIDIINKQTKLEWQIKREKQLPRKPEFD